MQIAQVPDRHEPDSAGEIDYSYIFDVLEREGYDGYIGLEYNPAGKVADVRLSWLFTYCRVNMIQHRKKLFCLFVFNNN